jgi:glycosyltransferase involved in cell wall biosynthesis
MKEQGTSRIRVAFYHDSHGYGGMELYMLRLMRHLDRSRYQPMVVVPGFQDRYRSSSHLFLDDVARENIPLLQPSNPGTQRGISVLREIISLRKLLRSKEIDILHIHSCRPEGARKAILAARLARVPVVIKSEHFPPTVTASRAAKYKVKLFDAATDRIVAGSDGDRREQIEELGRPAHKVVRIYNGVDLNNVPQGKDIRSAKRRLGLDPDLPVLCTIGRLVPQKGQRYLLQALPSVVSAYGPLNVLLVGDGELRAELEELAHTLGVAPHVHFVGFQQDVIPFIHAADIAVMPSLFEVLSLSMLEFMAAGKPVIGTNHSSFLEAIHDRENGLIVPMKDSRALAKAVVELLHDEPFRLRLGTAAQERVQANFSFVRLANDMMELYDIVLKNKGRRTRPTNSQTTPSRVSDTQRPKIQ